MDDHGGTFGLAFGQDVTAECAVRVAVKNSATPIENSDQSPLQPKVTTGHESGSAEFILQ
ncbi:hypothetical protein AB0F96_13410 [Streptomyces sp. NPDC023998]|uniref:hypothetical protein n=1 Tax=Streptomyces sp. NPDC023998 TaxID=3154597 RepID=UPI0033E5A0DE